MPIAIKIYCVLKNNKHATPTNKNEAIKIYSFIEFMTFIAI